MNPKPSTAAGYAPELAEQARSLCLYVATILGDFLDDIAVVGGLVPYLIVDQDRSDATRHVGTGDLDLGFSLAILDDERYHEVASRLRTHGFRPEPKENGNARHQTWGLPGSAVTIDFLIGEMPGGPAPGKTKHLEADLAAFVASGLPLAFTDFDWVEIDGTTTRGERAARRIRVCGPAALVAMKALAFKIRGEFKDAYDLVYVLVNHADGVDGIARRWATFADHPDATKALAYLKSEFRSEDHTGPRRYASFVAGHEDPVKATEAFGVVQTLILLLEGGGAGRRDPE